MKLANKVGWIAPPSHVAFLGTGLMGEPMARNLLRADFRLKVWNRTARKTEGLVAAGAEPASSPSDAVREVEALVMMLENGAVVTDVLFQRGVAAACAPGTLVIDMSSIAPAIAEDHARLLTERGLRYLDAPVSGGTIGAAKGSLAIMAGGSVADVESAALVFRALGTVAHVGPHGRGQLCKLVNQTILAVTIGAVAEGLLLAKAGGADPAQVRKAILGGFCQSRVLEEHGQRMLDRNFVPGGAVRNQLKDLDAVLEVARKVGLSLPLTERVRDLFAALAKSGKEDLDHGALILQLEGEGSGHR